MNVMSFKAQGGWTEVSLDEDGRNLPTDIGPWIRFRYVLVEKPEDLEVLKRDGYLLLNSQA